MKNKTYREVPFGPLLPWEGDILVPIDRSTRDTLKKLGKQEGLGLRHTVIKAIREFIDKRSNKPQEV